jgi:hypothetical protein
MQPRTQATDHARHPSTSRRPASASPQDVALLARLIGGDQRAASHARMQPPDSPDGKYLTSHRAITDAQLAAHLAGHQTHAIKLIARDNRARAWAVDVDEGGAEAVRARVDALTAAGLPCLGIAGQGATGHDGGHIWGVYATPVTPADAKAQIAAALTAAGLPTGEIWPSGVHIRAPFGVHTHTGRRGALIRPGLPDVSLDTPDGLALGLASLASLAPSPTPPPLPDATPRPIASVGDTSRPLAGKGGATVRDLIAAFNHAHPIGELLSRYGAQRTRDGWACNCGLAHSHPTQLAETTGGNAIFFSHRCGWAPTRTDRNGRPTADPFDLFTIVEHRGDKSAALRALRLALPRRSAAPPPVSDTRDRRHTAPEAIEARQQDAQRQHEAHVAASIATLQAVRDRAAEDAELRAYAMAAAVLRALLEHAKEQTSCRPSKAALAAQLGCSERTIQRALVWLESRYIRTETFTTAAGHVWIGGRQSTPRRTFLKVPMHRTPTGKTAPAGETRTAPGTAGTIPAGETWAEAPVYGTPTAQTAPAGETWTATGEGSAAPAGETRAEASIYDTPTPQTAPAGETREDTAVSPKYEYYESLDFSESWAGEGGATPTPASADDGLAVAPAPLAAAAAAWETWEWAPDAGDGWDVAPPSPAVGLVAGTDSAMALDAAEEAAILADEARILAYRAQRAADTGVSATPALVAAPVAPAPVAVPALVAAPVLVAVPALVAAPVLVAVPALVAVPVSGDGYGQLGRVAYVGGACYDPQHDLFAGGVPWPELAAPITPEVEPLSAELQAALAQLTEAAAPPVYGPPADPERRRKYFSLLGAARKARSPGQRCRLQSLAAALAEPQTQAEASRRQTEAALVNVRRAAGQPTAPLFALLDAAQAEPAGSSSTLADAPPSPAVGLDAGTDPAMAPAAAERAAAAPEAELSVSAPSAAQRLAQRATQPGALPVEFPSGATDELGDGPALALVPRAQIDPAHAQRIAELTGLAQQRRATARAGVSYHQRRWARQEAERLEAQVQQWEAEQVAVSSALLRQIAARGAPSREATGASVPPSPAPCPAQADLFASLALADASCAD